MTTDEQRIEEAAEEFSNEVIVDDAYNAFKAGVQWRDKIILDAIAEVESWYPESVFPENGASIDCNSASMARLTCRNIREAIYKTLL